MTGLYLETAVTPSVSAAQEANGSAGIYDDGRSHDSLDRLTENELAFIATRDSFYFATVSETGWPYVQHRGGPPGFLRVLDDRTLAFADFRGNRQYISLGNLAANDRASLFLMDYPRRARLKIFAHVEVHNLADDAELAARLATPGYRGRIERGFVLRLHAFDWNCPQHITPRYTEAEIARAVVPMRERIKELEAENARLLQELAARTGETRP
jgi:predicted pyridoxine 5'-phosphate oxidase superfamily flavin-nucleotide-binding protein